MKKKTSLFPTNRKRDLKTGTISSDPNVKRCEYVNNKCHQCKHRGEYAPLFKKFICKYHRNRNPKLAIVISEEIREIASEWLELNHDTPAQFGFYITIVRDFFKDGEEALDTGASKIIFR